MNGFDSRSSLALEKKRVPFVKIACVDPSSWNLRLRARAKAMFGWRPIEKGISFNYPKWMSRRRLNRFSRHVDRYECAAELVGVALENGTKRPILLGKIEGPDTIANAQTLYREHAMLCGDRGSRRETVAWPGRGVGRGRRSANWTKSTAKGAGSPAKWTSATAISAYPAS
jgi:hypothetical protein